MIRKLVDYLREPGTGQMLRLVEFDTAGNNIIEGVLINTDGTRLYPVISGVPVMLPDSLTSDFYKRHESKFNDLRNANPSLSLKTNDRKETWSFSLEWEYHSENTMSKTWGLSADDRYSRFLHENQVEESKLNSMLLLDAGCGNGIHTENLAAHGTTIIGIDYSDSVFAAEKNRKRENVFFVKGDLQNPPFAPETFDLIFSNGVIHHTPNTHVTFKQVAKLVKKNGSLYVWLYNRQGKFFWKLKRYIFDVMRMIVCRLPDALKSRIVNIVSSFIYTLYRLGGKKLDRHDLKLDIYDGITPRWRHYHEPIEVQAWYHSENFSKILITNWETLYGYGMLGWKK